MAHSDQKKKYNIGGYANRRIECKVAYRIAKQLLEQIEAHKREFTPQEREITLGLLGLTGAATFRDMAEFSKLWGQQEAFNQDANDANSKYAQYEQRQSLLAQYIKELGINDYL